MFLDLHNSGLLDGRRVALSDINADVIGCYLAVRDRPADVVAALRRLEAGHRKGGDRAFLRGAGRRVQSRRGVRSMPSADPAAAYTPALAAMLIYLNRTGFNGLFRVNARGEFNVPAGRYANPLICDEANLYAWSAALRRPGVTIEVAPFDAVLAARGQDDFVYLDPPYAPLSGTARFTAYTAGGFGAIQQETLQRTVIALASRGASVLLSNSAAPQIKALVRAPSGRPDRPGSRPRPWRRGARSIRGPRAAAPSANTSSRTSPAARCKLDPLNSDMEDSMTSATHSPDAHDLRHGRRPSRSSPRRLSRRPARSRARSSMRKGEPVDGAKIAIYNQQTNRTLETKTNKKGEYIQVGLSPGKYRLTASKGDLSDTMDVDVRLEMGTHDFTLAPGRGGGAGASKEEVAKAKAKADVATKTFNEGVALSNDGKTDEAIAKFQEVLVAIPNCAECYANIGTVQTRAKKYDEAEAAFKKAIELKPDFAEAYNGLANLYNTTKKFDLAAEASKKAMELSAAAGGAAGAAGAGGRCVGGRSTRASFSGTPARSPRPRRSSSRP